MERAILLTEGPVITSDDRPILTYRVQQTTVMAWLVPAMSSWVVSDIPMGSCPTKVVFRDQRRLDELVAKDEIREQLYNYARGLDRMDKPLALSVWHPDATVRTPGGDEITGVEWIESAWRGHARIAAHSHQMTNALIHVDGDRAVSETYVMASLHAEPSSETANATVYRVRYADRWSKRSGRWAMDHRAVIVDFTTSHDSTGPNSQSAGRRDTTDPLYQIYR